MKLVIGTHYNGYTYHGVIEGDDYACDICHKHHYNSRSKELYGRLHYFTSDTKEEQVFIGTSCIKQANFYTNLLGIVKGGETR